MLQTGLWQEAALQALVKLFEPDERICALILKGSYANDQLTTDTWSDIDVTVVCVDGQLEAFFPATDWLAAVGELYTVNQSAGEQMGTTRACFTDFRRIDFSFVSESALTSTTIQSTAVRVLFSRSARLDGVLIQTVLQAPPVHELSAEGFAQMANDFWFKGMLTTSKVMRNDLLIATHLALELIQDVCVVAMLLRDREYGTSHHREGGMGNEFIEQLNLVRPMYTRMGILESVKSSCLLFDILAARWSDSYQAQRQPLIAWIEFAQASLHDLSQSV